MSQMLSIIINIIKQRKFLQIVSYTNGAVSVPFPICVPVIYHPLIDDSLL